MGNERPPISDRRHSSTCGPSPEARKPRMHAAAIVRECSTLQLQLQLQGSSGRCLALHLHDGGHNNVKSDTVHCGAPPMRQTNLRTPLGDHLESDGLSYPVCLPLESKPPEAQPQRVSMPQRHRDDRRTQARKEGTGRGGVVGHTKRPMVDTSWKLVLPPSRRNAEARVGGMYGPMQDSVLYSVRRARYGVHTTRTCWLNLDYIDLSPRNRTTRQRFS